MFYKLSRAKERERKMAEEKGEQVNNGIVSSCITDKRPSLHRINLNFRLVGLFFLSLSPSLSSASTSFGDGSA